MPSYPASVKTFSTKQDLVDINYADHINDLQKEVVAVEQTLGTNPQGEYDTVRQRIESFDNAKADEDHSHGTGDIGSGVFGVPRGGTGRSSLANGYYLRGAGTSQVALVAPNTLRNDIGAATSTHTHDSDYAPIQSREQIQVFNREGELIIQNGSSKLVFPWGVEIVALQATLGTAPEGSNVEIRLNAGSSGVATLVVSENNTVSNLTSLSHSVSSGEELTVDVLGVGSTFPGSDLNLVVTYRRA